MNRRGFLTGLVSTLAAPAIVRAELLMPIKAIVPFDPMEAYYKLMNAMIDGLAEQVAYNIMHGSPHNEMGFFAGLKISHNNVTEGTSCQIYPYQPLKIKPIWASDLFLDNPIRSPTNGS